jgi:four helix bundle protein
MTTTFGYEQLHVYQRALAFCGSVGTLAKNWESWHAIADHLPRAAESVVVNLAEACAVFSQAKRNVLDYSLGSTLECAAGLDIAGIKGLVDTETVLRYKKELAEGNGRFSELDHRRFLDVAYRSTVKMAAQLDLCAQMHIICAADAGTGKGLLVRVASMTVRMAHGK